MGREAETRRVSAIWHRRASVASWPHPAAGTRNDRELLESTIRTKQAHLLWVDRDGSDSQAISYPNTRAQTARMRCARSSKRYEAASANRPETIPVTTCSTKGMR